MIKCYLCPLNDVCPVPKSVGHFPGIELKLNWLPEGSEDQCPLYKAARNKEPEMIITMKSKESKEPK